MSPASAASAATATGASDFISAKEKELLDLVAKCSNQQRDAVD
jgi:hypothetical protein